MPLGDQRTLHRLPHRTLIQDAEQLRIHTLLVIDGRNVEAGAVSVRLRGRGNADAKPSAQVITGILTPIRERRASSKKLPSFPKTALSLLQ